MGFSGTHKETAVLCAGNAVDTLPAAGCGPADPRIRFAGEEAGNQMVLSQGARHDLGGLLAFLDDASHDGLSRFELRQAHMTSNLRKEVMDLIEAWIDAQALKRSARWQMSQPRKLCGAQRAVREEVPADLDPLDPFFRSVAESAAIRRNQTPLKIRRWPIHFERFGCLHCGSKENYGAVGFCHRCHVMIVARLRDIEIELRCDSR